MADAATLTRNYLIQLRELGLPVPDNAEVIVQKASGGEADALRFEALAESVGERDLKEFYLKKAREARGV